ncbi:MAG: valine--tRNA ligase [Alistipes sp.]|jgi:valyl-tRNA synthetase|nr:valine--tRNA ligase [Alistipes sp.]
MKSAEKYLPGEIEGKWYEHWDSKGFFHSEPESGPNARQPYTMVIPPPNVTGILHMGHILNNTLQDVLVRRARMMGKNACWVPGTDHASIATEAKVVAKLAAAGISKNDLTREEFLKHAWEWKEEHGGMILRQLRKLGASCDWRRTKFTMDADMSESVVKTFVRLHEKGLIYRGVRMVNWDPAAQTALSDEEVVHREQQGKLYYLRYVVEGSSDGEAVIVATTRPETILGDVAVCVNPADPRYAALRGRRVTVPLVGRSVPVIEDDYVDVEFGTGALKITPAHDVNDFAIGEKFGLEAIDIFNPDGTINDRVGMYVGEDRFAVREKIAGELAAAGLMHKAEDYTNKVGFSERTGAAIEPKLSMQWFVRMESLAEPALKVVMDDTVRFVPAKYKNTYNHWMSGIKDWCISRQLWWGQRIPAYFLPGGGFVVAETASRALELARVQAKNDALQLSDLRQDEDVLDTWFSSWLWPISVFDGVRNPDNADINYYYPTADLVTGPDIIFFWVARMIMAGLDLRGRVPFGAVYFTGLVRDKQGRKMSKQLGNSPDALELIEKYGADGVRMGMMLSTSAGNDVMFDEAMCEQGRNFGNKIWNAWRLVEMWRDAANEKCEAAATSDSDGRSAPQPEHSRLAGEWFEAALSRTLTDIEADFAEYRISDALMKAYKLFWDDFSGWYLEIVKPAYGAAIDNATLTEAVGFFERLLQLLHPFIPFVTEELWHCTRERGENDCVTVSRMPAVSASQPELLARFDLMREAVTAIRAVRRARNIPMRDALELKVVADENYPTEFAPVLAKMAGLGSIDAVAEKNSDWEAFMVKTTRYFVPVGERIDREAELAKLREELTYQQQFLAMVMKKLSNERFVASAPAAVVATEQAKRTDAEARIAALGERIAEMER